MSLAVRSARSAILGLLVLGVLVFVPARTFDYWQGWTFIIVFAAATNIIGIYLAFKDPVLLERRIRAGPAAETRPRQKLLITLAFAGMIALVIVAVLDHRFGWSHVPAWVAILGNILMVLGLMVDLRVFQENSFGASTIATMAGQTVISTGPYALVRHPMYSGVLNTDAGSLVSRRPARCGIVRPCLVTC